MIVLLIQSLHFSSGPELRNAMSVTFTGLKRLLLTTSGRRKTRATFVKTAIFFFTTRKKETSFTTISWCTITCKIRWLGCLRMLLTDAQFTHENALDIHAH